MNHLPLHGITVLEFSQYLSGPSAGLRLADLGARVIKIERPGTGDAGRRLAIKDLWVDDSSLLFHTINRNKESFVADLKSPEDIEWVKKLIARADVMIHNFRPGVMEKVGLGYNQVKLINERMIYAEISGYGKEGAWKDRPGQDLLLQSMTGLAFTSGNFDDDPTPFGIAIADILCGAQLVQGILAGLIRRQKTGSGALVELSLMESLLDFQFELFTTYHASGILPKRSAVSNGNPLLSAPYGIYKTEDGHIAIAMADIQQLSIALDCSALQHYGTKDVFGKRDEIKAIISNHVAAQNNLYWICRLQHAGLWAVEVMNWQQLTAHRGYQTVQMEQTLFMPGGQIISTTRCPIRFNNKILLSEMPAPQLGANTACIKKQLAEGQPL
jgi:CoA:oxalate CoA-transferase